MSTTYPVMVFKGYQLTKYVHTEFTCGCSVRVDEAGVYVSAQMCARHRQELPDIFQPFATWVQFHASIDEQTKGSEVTE